MRTIQLACIMAAALVLAGCNTAATPNYDAKFGEAVRQSRALQTVNPSAGANTDPVAGIDARAARSSVERYQDSYRAPPQTFDVMGIGGSSLGGQ